MFHYFSLSLPSTASLDSSDKKKEVPRQQSFRESNVDQFFSFAVNCIAAKGNASVQNSFGNILTGYHWGPSINENLFREVLSHLLAGEGLAPERLLSPLPSSLACHLTGKFFFSGQF